MAENKEKLNSLLMEMKDESEKAGLKLNIQTTTTTTTFKRISWHPAPSFHGK